jgi:hypothetical protein
MFHEFDRSEDRASGSTRITLSGMHSLVARLRGRAVSQATTDSGPSYDVVPPTPDTSTFPRELSDTQNATPHTLVDQKILPQVHELMDSFSVVDLGSPGLSPRPTRKRNAATIPVVSNTEAGPSRASPSSLGSASPSHSAVPSEKSSLREGKANFSSFSRRLSSAGVWSTFGRNQPGVSSRSSRVEQQSFRTGFTFGSMDTLAMPRPSDISRVDGAGTMASSVYGRPSVASDSSGALPGQSGAPSHRRPNSLTISLDEPIHENSSSSDTTSLRPHSTKPSPTSRSSRSSRSQLVAVHTPSTPTFEVPSSSPRTFGQITPEQSSSIPVFSASLPPPLPPLSHPELVAAMAARSQPILCDLSNTLSTPRLKHWDSRLHAKTYPPRRRHKTEGNVSNENSVPFPSMPRSRKSFRSYASVPRVRQLFQAEDGPRRNSSKKSSRRSSAEWNAKQAASGVISRNPSADYGWPAAVSKEILRLSLGGDATIGNPRMDRDALETTTGDPDIIHRVRNVPVGGGDPARPCSPLLSPQPTPRGESQLGISTSFCSQYGVIGQTERGDKQSQPHHHADILLSGKPVGVVEVEEGMDARGLSTLRENGDHGRQSSTLPRPAGSRTYRKSILRQSFSSMQEHEQEAGPSAQQNVNDSPPARRSSMRHPARHSSEPALASVLETPATNKGKRKAEEIDLTPPDQKHHHAKFIIPADHRRECAPVS